MARYSWLLGWAERQPQRVLQALVRRETARYEAHPERVSTTDRQRLAAARHQLGLAPLRGLPDVTR